MVNPAQAGPLDVEDERVRERVHAGRADALAWLWERRDDPSVLQAALQSESPLVRAHAGWIRAEAGLRRGDVNSALRLRRELGWIDRAWMAPAEPGRRPSELPADRWRPLHASLARGLLRPSGALGVHEQRSAWLAIVIDAGPDPRRVRLRLGHSGRGRLIVPGAAPVELEPHRQAALDQSGFALDAGPGPFPIFVHLWDTPSAGELLVRVTDDGERSPSSLRVATERAALELALASPPDPSKAPALRRLRPPGAGLRRADRATDLALRARLGALLGSSDREALPSPTERDLRRVLRLDPTWARGWALLAEELRPRSAHAALDAFEQAISLQPGLAAAWIGRGDLARERGRWLDAARAYERALTADPRAAEAWARRSQLGFDVLGETALAVHRLETSPVSGHPAVRSEAARIHLALGNARAAGELARLGRGVDRADPVLRRLAFDAATRSHDRADAIRIAEEGVVFEPDRARWFLELARLRFDAPDRATAITREAIRRFPTLVEPRVVAAELAVTRGDLAAARGHLERARALDPRREDLAAQLRRLDGPPAPERETAKTEAWTQRPPSPAERRHGAEVLFDHRDIELFPDGSWTREIHRAVRVRAPDRHPDRATVFIDYAPTREQVRVFEARRIDEGGEPHPPARDRDEGPTGPIDGMYVDQHRRRIDFGPLEPGDVVEVRYRVESLGANPFGTFFGSVEPAQDTIPVRDFRLRTRSPPERPLHAVSNGLEPPTRRRTADSAWIEWSSARLPPLVLEPLGPAYTELGAFLSLSTHARWSDLAEWYAELYRPQLTLDPEAKAAARAATSGAQSDADVTAALVELVIEATRYVGIELGIHGWKPFPAHEVFRRRYGDCKDMSTLLIAMLAEHGIDASLVLVRTADRGPFPDDAVNLWAFNHAIVHVPFIDLFVDPTAEHTVLGELPPFVQGGLGLVVAPDGEHRRVSFPVSPPEANANRARYEATVSRDGVLRLAGRESYRGAPAAEIRRRFEALEGRDRELERHLGRRFPGLSIESLAFESLDRRRKSVRFRYEASVGRHGQTRDDQLVIPLSLFQHDLAGSFAPWARRQTSIHLAHSWSARNRVAFALPAEAELVELPEARRIDTPWVSLEQTVSRTSSGWTVEDLVTFHARSIPAESYGAFREACLAIDRAMNRKVVVRWE